MQSKECVKCKITKPLTEFSKHKRMAYGVDTRCKECIKLHNQEMRKIHAMAPPKPATCDCCKKEANRLYADHIHGTLNFRGWVCASCNHGIACLGDTYEGVLKALTYLSTWVQIA